MFGDTAILGDRRWAGAYGIDADFIAGEHCSIASIHTSHIQVNDVNPRFPHFLAFDLIINAGLLQV